MAARDVFVGAVVRKDECILLVRQSPGHPLEGQWTIPWGRIEAGESPAAAALRETREEGAVEARLEGLIGLQELPAPLDGCFALVFMCAHARGEPEADGRETDAARYFSDGDFAKLSEPIEPWSDWLVRRIFAGRYVLIRQDESGPFHPKSAFI